MKNSNDTIGNRTRDLPARSSMPQPTAPPRDAGYPRLQTHTRNVIFIAFPLLQSLRERASLRYTYIDCLVRVLHLRLVSSKRLVTRTLSSHEQQEGQMLIKCVVHA